MSSRTDNHRAFGPQLDSLIDIVSFGVFPALFLLSYGRYSPWFLPGAFLIIGTSAIRLSYFNVFGMIDKTTYKGLALDNNVIILSFVFLFEGFFKQPMFAIIIYIILVAMLALNLAPIKTYKFSGRWSDFGSNSQKRLYKMLSGIFFYVSNSQVFDCFASKL